MPATDRATPSVYLQAKQLVQQAIIALKLDGLHEKEVVIRDGPWNDTKIFRGVTLWGNKRVLGHESSNRRNHVGYACVCSLICGNENSTSGGASNDRLPLWKTCIARRFDYQQLAGLDFPGATHLICTVQDHNLRIPTKHPDAGNNYKGDQLIVWYWVREPKDDGE